MKFLEKHPTIVVIDEVSSTNFMLKEWAKKDQLVEGMLLHAYFQTRGEGQQGNSWESEVNMNITSSIYLEPIMIIPRHQFQLSIAAALGVYDFISQFVLAGLSIKWPNDIYIYDKKIAGILIDNSIMRGVIQQSVWGLGININQINFSSWVPNPTSLRIETGKNHSIEELLPILQDCLMKRYANIGGSQYEEYLHLIYRREGFYEYNSEGISFIATFLGVNSSGHLILRTNEGDIREFVIKELQYVI